MLIKVKAKTQCKLESVVKAAPDSFVICVKQKPAHGLANKRIIELLIAAGYKNVRLIKGAHTPSKIFEVTT